MKKIITIRGELTDLLVIFQKVFSSKDGKEGLRTFLENEDEINIILTDI